jgi:hypothetical protein
MAAMGKRRIIAHVTTSRNEKTFSNVAGFKVPPFLHQDFYSSRLPFAPKPKTPLRSFFRGALYGLYLIDKSFHSLLPAGIMVIDCYC